MLWNICCSALDSTFLIKCTIERKLTMTINKRKHLLMHLQSLVTRVHRNVLRNAHAGAVFSATVNQMTLWSSIFINNNTAQTHTPTHPFNKPLFNVRNIAQKLQLKPSITGSVSVSRC